MAGRLITFMPAGLFWRDALGVKLRKEVRDRSEITTTDYFDASTPLSTGGFILMNEKLDFFPHSEGYVKVIPGGNYYEFQYVFQYKDHLGNIRLSYSDTDGDGSIEPRAEIIEEHNYYPFGLQHKGYNNVVNGVENNYKNFQGRELTKDLGLNVLEYKYRMHDSAIGRFWQVDPLAEKFYHNSTYAFAENKVIDHIELEGLEGLHHTLTDEHGNKTHQIEKNVVILTEKKIEIPKNATDKQVNKINRQNGRIESRNNARVSKIQDELKQFYKLGSNEGFKNKAGEKVTFKFNISTKDVTDTTGKSGIDGMNAHQFAQTNGLESTDILSSGDTRVAPATVFTTNNPRGSEGSTRGNLVNAIMGGMEGTSAHEMIHTLGLPDNGYNKGGVLNSPPQLPTRSEVDKVINAAYQGNQQ